jgi:hypothetical protein
MSNVAAVVLQLRAVDYDGKAIRTLQTILKNVARDQGKYSHVKLDAIEARCTPPAAGGGGGGGEPAFDKTSLKKSKKAAEQAARRAAAPLLPCLLLSISLKYEFVRL